MAIKQRVWLDAYLGQFGVGCHVNIAVKLVRGFHFHRGTWLMSWTCPYQKKCSAEGSIALKSLDGIPSTAVLTK